MGTLTIKIAKAGFSKKLQIKILGQVKKLLENEFKFKDAIEILMEKKMKKTKGKKPPFPDAEYEFLMHVRRRLADGAKPSESFVGWFSDTEIMLISAGEAKSLPGAIGLAIGLMENLSRINTLVKKAISGPMFYIGALFGVMFAFAAKMVPVMEELLPVDKWPEDGKSLYDFSMSIYNGWYFYVIGGVVTFVLVKQTLPIFTGPMRKKFFDRFPPWSIYKELNAAIFVVSLATLMQAGVKLMESLVMLERKSVKYVGIEVSIMKRTLAQVEDSGQALTAETDFLGEIGDEILIFARGHDFSTAMLKVGDDAINEKIEEIQKRADFISQMIKLSLFAVVGWIVIAFFSITDEIQRMNEENLG